MTSSLTPPSFDKRLVSMALLVALGVVLHRVEALLPLPAPWIKLGLANVMTLLALVFLGFREALIVTGMRVFLGSIIGGTFLGPTFFLSFTGGLAAILAMALVYRRGSGPFSLIGVSVVGAVTHVLAITFSVYFVFIPQEAFLYLLPIFLSLALVSGILTGIAGNVLSDQLAEANVTFR